MYEAKYEFRYLMVLISALLEQKKLPISSRKIDWDVLFKLSDVHNVANIIHYAVLAIDDEISDESKEKFYAKYQESLQERDRLQTTMEVVAWQLERHRIHSIFLKDMRLGLCYPHPEMDCVRALEISTAKGKSDVISLIMEEMDYKKADNPQNGGIRYQKTAGMKLIFYPSNYFSDKKIRKYYDSLLRHMPSVKESQYVHMFGNEEYFIYLSLLVAERFSFGEITIRDMLDFWVFYAHYFEDMEWDYIWKQLEKLKSKSCTEWFLKFAATWFQGSKIDDMLSFDATEKYILSGGKEGRAACEKIIPLKKRVADFYERDKRKEWIQGQIKWIFPTLEYMECLYPILKKLPSLLILCWGLRIFRAFRYVVKIKSVHIAEKVKSKFSKKNNG